MRKISADYIFPVSSAPIKNGIVVVDEDGTIASPPAPLLKEMGEGSEEHTSELQSQR